MTIEQTGKYYERAIQRLAQAVAKGCTLAQQAKLEQALDKAEAAYIHASSVR